jgi:hypothetical protein
MMLSAARHFADAHGYSVLMLWGVSSGVCFCRFGELLAPIPGVRVLNVRSEQLGDVERCARSGKDVTIGQTTVRLYRPGQPIRGDFFSWDLRDAWALAKLVPGRLRHLVAPPSPQIKNQADAYARRHGLAHRLGIRVRVEEFPYRDRKPHRLRRELDQVVKSIVRIPWYAKVFVATDSEYMQQMLASHFGDARFLTKKFDLQHPTGRYVHRLDKHAMFTFIQEVECLRQCSRIINIGGFLNDQAVAQRIMGEPYADATLMHLHPH